MDSWSRPSKHQATPIPFYLLPGGESTPYCKSCGRVISTRKSEARKSADTPAKYCSARCRSSKPGKLDREIERVFVRFLTGEEKLPDVKRTDKTKSSKGDKRLLVPCDVVQAFVFGNNVDAGETRDAGEKGDATERGDASEKGDVKGKDKETDMDMEMEMDKGQQDGTQPATLEEKQPRDSGIDFTTDTDLLSQPPSKESDYDVIARMSIRSGTRIRPSQAVSEVNGSVGGEKGWAERNNESAEMKEKREQGMREVRHKEMVKSAARRGVVFGFLIGQDQGTDTRRKCEAVMQGKVVEPSFAKGNWGVRWREEE